MNVLVTGGGGYLGSVLIPKLLLRGHNVRVLDKGYFGIGHLLSFRPSIDLIREDLRRIEVDNQFRRDLVEGCDCIIHLAAISNDPSSELDPELTEAVNFRATEVIAEEAKTRRIRFVFSSTCSVYGEAIGELSEESAVNPLTVYAASKVKAERMLQELADSTWSPIILRNGTLFGYSPRMRFDLVINVFCLYSTLYNEIKVFNGGRQWRPFLQVSDCARAFVFFAEQRNIAHCCYNVAYENRQVADLVDVLRGVNPHLQVKYMDLPNEDRRNYRVSTKRLREIGFEPRIGIEQGVHELSEAIVSGLIRDPESVFYRNAKWLKELMRFGMV